VFALRSEVPRLRLTEAASLAPSRLRRMGSPARSHAVPCRVRSLRSRRRASELGGARVAVHAALRRARRLAGSALRQDCDQHDVARRLADGRHDSGARRSAAPRADRLGEGDGDRHRRVVVPQGPALPDAGLRPRDWPHLWSKEGRSAVTLNVRRAPNTGGGLAQILTQMQVAF